MLADKLLDLALEGTFKRDYRGVDCIFHYNIMVLSILRVVKRINSLQGNNSIIMKTSALDDKYEPQEPGSEEHHT